MNTELIKLSAEWRAVLRALSIKDIESLFSQLYQSEFIGFSQKTDQELTDIRARVKFIEELEAFFLEVRKRKAAASQTEELESDA